MQPNTPKIDHKFLISQKDLARKLGMSVDALRKLQKIDPIFAQAMIKMGSTRQAAVFYIVAEILKWIESKKLRICLTNLLNANEKSCSKAAFLSENAGCRQLPSQTE